MLTKLSFLILFFMLFAESKVGMAQTTCVSLYTGPLWNPNAVYYDTCSGSPTYGERYSKVGYDFLFDHYIFSSLLTPVDTVTRTWADIDTSYAAVRAAFQTIETRFGSYVFVKQFPSDVDTASYFTRWFRLQFDQLVCVDSVVTALKAINVGEPNYVGGPYPSSHQPSDNGIVPGKEWRTIAFDNSYNPFNRFFSPLGWQWYIYKLKLPMAWEITQGQNTIHIIAADEFSDVFSHPDVATNFRQIAATDGGKPTDPLGGFHGLVTLAMAMTAADNGYGLVGTCPNCTGLAIDGEAHTTFKVDVDGANGKLTPPEIQYAANGVISVSDKPECNDFIQVMKSGGVIISSAGNSFGNSHCSSQCGQYVTDALGNQIYYPSTVFWEGEGENSYIWDDANPSRDIHSLTVGGTWLPFACSSPYLMSDKEEFNRDYDFSPGVDKFDLSGTAGHAGTLAQRHHRRQQAFMDVVAPSENIIVPVHSANGYDIAGGTSEAAPMVAGIVGLMRSVDYYLGADLTAGIPTDPVDVQRRMYKYITLTADKIYDYDNVGTDHLPHGLTNWFAAKGYPSDPADPIYATGKLDPLDSRYAQTPMKLWQYDYITSSDDPLHRSWAQRVGFGRVNAYRALAQSIPLKGEFQYTTSATLSFSGSPDSRQNEEGKYLMHFGAWKDATSLFVNAGGNIIPNQSPAWPHANQGKTIINSGGTGTTLTVPSGSILAIDGLVLQTSAIRRPNKIVTATTGAKILATGYLEDVELSGKTKIDDLIIYSGNTSGYSRIYVGSGQTSDVYGVVSLQGNGNFVVDGGDLVIQPGGEIHMDGNKPFDILGGTVTMNASSKIVSATKEVVVESGSELIISGLLPVDILTTLHVKAGGKVTINSDANLRVDKFIIDRDGIMQCEKRGRLTLNTPHFSYCYGKFLFGDAHDDDNNRRTITAGVNNCGEVYQTAGISIQGELSNATEAAKTRVTLGYTDVVDVCVEVIDAKKSPFTHDYFSMNSYHNGHPLGVNEMLEVMNTSLVGTSDDSIIALEVDHCRFFDGAGSVRDEQHNADGIFMQNLYSAWIHNSKFYNLDFGVRSLHCSNVAYKENTFGKDPQENPAPVVSAIQDNTSGILYCGNDVARCGYGGITLLGASHGSLHDNLFSYDSLWNLAVEGSSTADLRNNRFTAYDASYQWPPQYCLWAVGSGSVINMHDIGGSLPIEWGKNILNSGSVSNYAYDLVRGRKSLDAGDIYVACGYNYFGSYSIYHVVSLEGNYNMAIQYNQWEPLNQVRPKNVIPSGFPRNVSSEVTSSCDNQFDWSSACSDIIARLRNGTWLTLTKDDPVLKTAFNDSHTLLLNTSATVGDRRDAAIDELWSAALVDSPAIYLAKAMTDYRTVMGSSSTPPDLKSSVRILQGHVHEMIGQVDSAALAFSDVLTNYHQYADSLEAQWGVDRTSIPHDTSTELIDSLWGTYFHRVHDDVIAMMDTVPHPQIAPKPAAPNMVRGVSAIALVASVRGEEADVVFTLPSSQNVTISLVDLLGATVATLYNQSANPGENKLSAPLSKLSSGVYFVRMQAGALVLTRKISLFR